MKVFKIESSPSTWENIIWCLETPFPPSFPGTHLLPGTRGAAVRSGRRQPPCECFGLRGISGGVARKPHADLGAQCGLRPVPGPRSGRARASVPHAPLPALPPLVSGREDLPRGAAPGLASEGPWAARVSPVTRQGGDTRRARGSRRPLRSPWNRSRVQVASYHAMLMSGQGCSHRPPKLLFVPGSEGLVRAPVCACECASV